MKYFSIVLSLILFSACRDASIKTLNKEPIIKVEKSSAKQINYPDELLKILEVHGGLDKWSSMKTLTFELHKENSKEVHTIDLRSRKDKIEFSEFSMGFDGAKTLILDTQNKYKGNPVFYHNLLFYFYAMPFVLTDEGIIYNKADDLVFEGKKYPGIHISFKQGVGIASNDEYFIHYDAETHQMTWLGYTVTYRSGKKSMNVKWMHYKDWNPVNGLLLPKELIPILLKEVL